LINKGTSTVQNKHTKKQKAQILSYVISKGGRNDLTKFFFAPAAHQSLASSFILPMSASVVLWWRSNILAFLSFQISHAIKMVSERTAFAGKPGVVPIARHQ